MLSLLRPSLTDGSPRELKAEVEASILRVFGLTGPNDEQLVARKTAVQGADDEELKNAVDDAVLMLGAEELGLRLTGKPGLGPCAAFCDLLSLLLSVGRFSYARPVKRDLQFHAKTLPRGPFLGSVSRLIGLWILFHRRIEQADEWLDEAESLDPDYTAAHDLVFAARYAVAGDRVHAEELALEGCLAAVRDEWSGAASALALVARLASVSDRT